MTRELRVFAKNRIEYLIKISPFVFDECDRGALVVAIQALSQESCEDWYDVPSDEMTLEQARQAVKDLRKKLAEYLDQQPCDDAVSREAVEQMIKAEMPERGAWEIGGNKGDVEKQTVCEVCVDLLQSLNELPSVTQKPIECDDAISREWLKTAIHNFYYGLKHTPTEEDIQAYIDVAPSVTQKPETVTEFADRCRECGARYGKLLKQKSGHWISHYDEDEKVGWYECDRCHTERAFNTRFCPDCGAYMREGRTLDEFIEDSKVYEVGNE